VEFLISALMEESDHLDVPAASTLRERSTCIHDTGERMGATANPSIVTLHVTSRHRLSYTSSRDRLESVNDVI